MSLRPFSAALLGVLVTLSAACDPDDGGGCPSTKACDIREAGCQERAAKLAACLRDDDATAISIPVEVVDADTFIEDRASEAAGEEEASAEELAFRKALSLVHLSREAMPLDDVRTHYEQVAAFYSPSDDRITILDRGDPLDDDGSFAILVHEMVHALQDQEGTLDTIMVGVKSYDEWLARRAVIEGEATFVQLRLSVRQQSYTEDEVDWARYFEDYQQDMLELAADSEDLFVEAPMLFPYAWGSDLVHQAYERGGYGAVRALYDVDRPTTTAQFMGFGDVPTDAERKAFAARSVPVLPVGFQPSSVSHMGPWFLEQLRTRLDIPGFIDQDALTVWMEEGADGAEPAPALYWRLSFDDDESGSWAVDDLAARGNGGHDGPDVWLAVRQDFDVRPPEPSAWQAVADDDLFFASDMAARVAARHVRPCAATRLPLPGRF